jgi:hypothetical protein
MAQVLIDKGVAILDLPMILLPNEMGRPFSRVDCDPELQPYL